MHVALEPIADGGMATIVTPAGRFSGPDHYITIRDLASASGVGERAGHSR